MPKASKKVAPSSAKKAGGIQGKSKEDQHYPAHHPYTDRGSIIVHDNDVLNGRGVNMAHHPGNERFRALVQSRSDPNYCSNYSLNEKKALAEEIVNHIEALDPPGRFLKRGCKTKKKPGPWELMTREEAIKKARQALRDCNRPDRVGYAKSVAAPSDVVESAMQRKSTGLSQQEYVQSLVATNPSSASTSGRSTPASISRSSSKRSPVASPILSHTIGDRGPPSHLDWLDTTATEEEEPHDSTDPSQSTPHLRTTTPTTAATSGGMFTDDPDDFHFHHYPHGIVDVGGAPTLESPTHHTHFHSLPSSPQAGFEEVLSATLHDDDIKLRSISSFHHPDHIHLQDEAEAAVLASFDGENDFLF